ncbi:MAG: hypothetical protein KAX26_07265, partial [Anaerolineae bacterium]|nr:hypothetical protein [Anaerolineae bacterium]
MKKYTYLLVVGAILAGLLAACAAPTPEVVEVTAVPVDYGKVTFLSTQGVPIEEAEAMRGVVLADFPGQVEFVPSEYEFFEDMVLAEAQAGTGDVDVLGALYGQYPTLVAAGALQDIGALMAELGDRGIPASSIELGKLGTDT